MPTLVRQATLLDVLVGRGSLTVAQAEQASSGVSGPERQLHASLVANGVISDVQLAQALAEQCGVSYHSLQEFRVDFEAFSFIPIDVMRQFECVPVGEEEGELLLALADPTDVRRLDQIERVIRMHKNVERDLVLEVAAHTASRRRRCGHGALADERRGAHSGTSTHQTSAAD